MTKTADNKPAASLTTEYGKTNTQCPEQAAVTRECKQPQTPRQITDADWSYGIGLN